MLNGEDFFKDKSDDFSSGRASSGFNSPSERTAMIEELFEKVLGRKPTSREASFYKYGVMPREEILEKLLTGDEHKKLLENAKKLPNVEDMLKDSEIDVKKLIQKVKDLGDENTEQQRLLDEKNRIIESLREELKNPYNLPSDIERYEEGFDVYRRGFENDISKESNRSVVEKIKDILNNILN